MQSYKSVACSVLSLYFSQLLLGFVYRCRSAVTDSRKDGEANFATKHSQQETNARLLTAHCFRMAAPRASSGHQRMGLISLLITII